MDTENQFEIIPSPAALPAIITRSGPTAPERFLEFFAANIRNPNTRRAYARQVMPFLSGCEGRGLDQPRQGLALLGEHLADADLGEIEQAVHAGAGAGGSVRRYGIPAAAPERGGMAPANKFAA